MKKMSMIKIIAVTICLVTSCLVYIQSKSDELSELVLDNIEALASNEGTDGYCFGSGEVDCYGYLVKLKIEGYKLK